MPARSPPRRAQSLVRVYLAPEVYCCARPSWESLGKTQYKPRDFNNPTGAQGQTTKSKLRERQTLAKDSWLRHIRSTTGQRVRPNGGIHSVLAQVSGDRLLSRSIAE